MKLDEKHTTAMRHVYTWTMGHLAVTQNLLYFGNRETIRKGLQKMLDLSSAHLKTRGDEVRNKKLFSFPVFYGHDTPPPNARKKRHTSPPYRPSPIPTTSSLSGSCANSDTTGTTNRQTTAF